MPLLPLTFNGGNEPLSVAPELKPARLESNSTVIGEIFIDPQNIFDLSDPKRLETATAETFPLVTPPPGSPMAFPVNCGPWVEPLSPDVERR